jgi:hypothetical protein
VIWTAGDISNVSSFINQSNGIVDVLVTANNALTGGALTNMGVVRRTFGTSTGRLILDFPTVVMLTYKAARSF